MAHLKEVQEALNALPARIKVRVAENNMGHLHIWPLDREHERLCGITNQHNHAGDIYLQVDTDVEEFIKDFPAARMVIRKSDAETYGGVRIGNRWYTVNDGVCFFMSTDDYLAWLGGQSG